MKRNPMPAKEPPKMRLVKVMIKSGKKTEYREVLMNASHPKFER